MMEATLEMLYKRGFKMQYDTSEFLELLLEAKIIDGRRGGLVLGPSHEDGGIYIFKLNGNGKLTVTANIEGGEFIVNSKSTIEYRKELDEINLKDEAWSYGNKLTITERTNILNAYGSPVKLIWLDKGDHYVINKYSTNRFFKKLEKLNLRE